MPEDAREIDLRGLKCPLPALKARKALKRAAPGERLAVLADDPLAGIDIPHLCRTEGHRLVATANEDGARRFLIERGERAGEARDQADGSE